MTNGDRQKTTKNTPLHKSCASKKKKSDKNIGPATFQLLVPTTSLIIDKQTINKN